MEINPEVLVNDIVKRTAEFTGVSEWSVKNICKELKETGILQMPGKKRNKPKTVLGKVEDFVKCAIHSKVHTFFIRQSFT